MTTTTAIVSETLAQDITAEVERRQRELQDSIRRYEEYIANKREEMTKVEGKLIEVFGVKARLEAAGFQVTYDRWSECLRVTIEQKQLTALYQVVGRFDGRNAEKEIEDSRKRLVRVRLTPVKYPFVSVSYVMKLPKRGAKCRIETVKVKARTEKRLVCEM